MRARADQVWLLKRLADSILLTVDGACSQANQQAGGDRTNHALHHGSCPKMVAAQQIADALASEAAESDPVCSIALDQDLKAVYFNLKGSWVEWDTRVREDLVQRAAGQYVASILKLKRGRAGAEASPPTLPCPLTASWLLRPNQGRSTLGKVLGEMKISTGKKQVLQSIAGALSCNAVLHKWGKVSSAACALFCHPAETQSHIQSLNVSVLHSRRPGSGPITTWPRNCGKALRTPPEGGAAGLE
jgi:hypothetical protein